MPDYKKRNDLAERKIKNNTKINCGGEREEGYYLTSVSCQQLKGKKEQTPSGVTCLYVEQSDLDRKGQGLKNNRRRPENNVAI